MHDLMRVDAHKRRFAPWPLPLLFARCYSGQTVAAMQRPRPSPALQSPLKEI